MSGRRVSGVTGAKSLAKSKRGLACFLYSANKLRLACSAQCHPMTPPDVCEAIWLRFD
jgi:hypothetical protein